MRLNKPRRSVLLTLTVFPFFAGTFFTFKSSVLLIAEFLLAAGPEGLEPPTTGFGDRCSTN